VTRGAWIKSGFAALLGFWLLIAPAVASPPAAGGDSNACNLLSNADLEPVLFDGVGGTLDSWSDHPASGVSTCRWEARLRTASPSAPPRVVTLAFYHLADREAAQAQLAGAVPDSALTGPSPALDGTGDDEVVRPATTVVNARHGADIVTLDAEGAELSHPEQMDTRYLLDSLALKAAGATVKPPPVSASPPTDWTPAANPQALSSVPGQWALLPLIFVLRHQFLVIFGGIFGSIAVSVARQSFRRSDAAPPRQRLFIVLLPIGIAALILEMLFGTSWADRLLHYYGTAAAATITDSYGTSVQYNSHNVMGYHVLVRPPRGGTIATGFEDDDFNVYPPHNATTYPEVGGIFTVRYFPVSPSNFVIISDDGSPWALARRCAEQRRAHDMAVNRARFSKSSADRAAAADTGAADCG
jgi:hypothetical protein